MNILYISSLVGSKWSGPNKSVPSQIKAQAQYDNVLWFNINDTPKTSWNVDVNFVNTTNVPSLNIEHLPKPFDKPDIVVFQGVYFIQYCKIAKQLRNKNIPYIIIPRSSLTVAGQRSKALKKKLGNAMFFNKFISGAAGIHYLTDEEYKTSGQRWNENYFILPNGADKKERTKIWEEKQGLRGVFIARLDIYQKGIDLLLDACNILKDELRDANCVLDIYGPDRNGSKQAIFDLILKYGLTDIVRLHDAIFDEDKENVLLDSDFFVLTSRFEGHPMGLIESLSYGLPCLVTTGTNMAKEIENADAGWTADINVESIVSAFRKLLNERKSLKDKGKNALTLSKTYNWDEIAKKSSQKYSELCNRSSLKLQKG